MELLGVSGLDAGPSTDLTCHQPHKWELSLFSTVRRQWQSHGNMSLAPGGLFGRQLYFLNFISFPLGKNPD